MHHAPTKPAPCLVGRRPARRRRPGVVAPQPAAAAGETVEVYLTTSPGSRGTDVVRGLQRQTSVTSGPAGGSANQTITVDESTRYQRFEAGGYDTNVRPLTQQAKQLNPALRVKAVPWSAPGWMRDDGRMDPAAMNYPA